MNLAQFLAPLDGIGRYVRSNRPGKPSPNFPANGDQDILTTARLLDELGQMSFTISQTPDHVTIVVPTTLF
jgi:hypothetical protein